MASTRGGTSCGQRRNSSSGSRHAQDLKAKFRVDQDPSGRGLRGRDRCLDDLFGPQTVGMVFIAETLVVNRSGLDGVDPGLTFRVDGGLRTERRDGRSGRTHTSFGADLEFACLLGASYDVEAVDFVGVEVEVRAADLPLAAE
jgi:hypothetical protein